MMQRAHSGSEVPGAAALATAVFYGALVLAVASQVWLAWTYGAMPASRRGEWMVAGPLTLVLAVPTAAVLWSALAVRSVPAGAGMMLAIGVAGLCMRLAYFGAGPLLEDDHFRYLLDGAMLASGASPYALAPEMVLRAPDLAPFSVDAAARDTIGQINFPDLRSIYPGTAQILFGLAHVVQPWSIDALRAIVLACEVATAGLLWWLLVRLGMPGQLTALLWCNPALAFLFTGQAHIDAALAPFVLGALLATQAGSGIAAGVLLGLATGVKLWPALMAPLAMRYLWGRGRKLAGFIVAFGIAGAVLCAPLLVASLSPHAGLVAYATGWNMNNAPFAWLSRFATALAGDGHGERVLRGMAAGLSLGLAVAMAWRPVADLRDLVQRAALLTAGLFYLSPAQFPWYVIWFLPLAAASENRALLAASAALPVYFLFFPLADAGLREVFGYGVAALHLVPVLALAVLARGGFAEGRA